LGSFFSAIIYYSKFLGRKVKFLKRFCPPKLPSNCQPSTGRVVGGLWVRLGKIKCAAKALACVLACSSFNFTKRWHFVHFFLSVYVSTVGRPTLACNGLCMVSGGFQRISSSI